MVRFLSYMFSLVCAKYVSALDLHVVRFGCQRGTKDGCVVWLPGILRPYKFKLSEQRNNYKEELHTCKTLSKTHTGT